ncbi:MAG: adenine deaminase [Candidatus Korarchaeota archaeon]|nr:adenine deaminase [Candidatus Korarchaeota archaeon]
MELKADLLLDGQYLNVYTGELLDGPVAILGDRILCVGERIEARRVERVDGIIIPGLKDGHIHIESSKLPPGEFARLVVPRGTTSVFADPHEIVNVAGKEGFKFMLEESGKIPLRVHLMVPSCVPASPLEESPFHLDAAAVSELLDEATGLGEVMNFPGVISGEEDLLRKVEEARRRRMPVDGHAPLLMGEELCLYLFRGVESDHESTTEEEALEKARKGTYVMVREGTASKDMSIIRGLLGVQKRRILLVSDDRSASDLMREGHVDHLLRRAVEEGLDPVEAVQAVTINVAERFGIRELDGIAPGRLADLVVVRDLKRFEALRVYIGGELVASNGEPLFSAVRVKKIGTMKLPSLSPMDLAVKVQGRRARVRVIELTGSLLTEEGEEWLPIEGGLVKAGREVQHLVVVERHGRTGHIGRGFVRGFGMSGAIASTVAHDSHNLIVASSDLKDMVVAARELERVGGGQVVVSNGKPISILPLPVGGLMSDRPAEEVASLEEELDRAYRSLGGTREDPFMELSFLALSVIPKLKLTPKGLVDVNRQEIVPPLLEVI